MSYSHMTLDELLDLADEVGALTERYPITSHGAGIKLAEIDTELLSRMPEGEFVTLLSSPLPIKKRDDGGEWGIVGHWYQPIGFEPYIPDEDTDWLFDALYGFIEGVPTVEG